jgi:NAD-dependent protein deacetylase/lipoamidase
VRCPAVGNLLAVALDPVVEPKSCAADVPAAGLDLEPVVEACRHAVANGCLGDEGLDSALAQRRVAAGKAAEVVDAGDLEPDQVGGVVGDALGVRLGEADANLGGEPKSVHGRNSRIAAVSAARLAQLIRDHQPCVALTGAGISTESGIPDFRSPTGLWAQFDPVDYGSLASFRADPERVWRFYAPRFASLTEAEPNAAHRALARLEQLGLLGAVVTQNIDLLHERAGSREVVEVHGSIRTSTCSGCGSSHALPQVLSLIDEGDGAPRCPACETVLKPDVVFFGELLPEEAIDRAFELARAAGLMLVVGSSLEVHPVAGLPLETIRGGGQLAIVNRGPTALDACAVLKLDGSAGEMLSAAVAELEPVRPS